MCLKFLLEANPENQALVSSLEAREVAPTDSSGKDVLEKMGVDVALGEDGKVKVTRSQGQGPRKAEWLLKKERERDRAGASGSGSARRMSQESLSARERFARLDLKERERGRMLGEAVEGDQADAERAMAEPGNDDKAAIKEQEEIEFM